MEKEKAAVRRRSTRKSSSDIQFDYSVKCVIIGDSGVGKTCMLQRLQDSKSPMETRPTIDGIFHKRFTVVDNAALRFSIWDTAGAEAFKSVTQIFYRGASCALLVFDMTMRSSFLSVPNWIEDLRQNSGNSKMVIILAANKSDLKSERQITTEEGSTLARLNNMEYVETSAKNLENLTKAFDLLADKVYHNIKIGNLIPNAEVNGIKLGEKAKPSSLNSDPKSKKCSC